MINQTQINLLWGIFFFFCLNRERGEMENGCSYR